jgi:hypothetical protein
MYGYILTPLSLPESLIGQWNIFNGPMEFMKKRVMDVYGWNKI